MNKSLIKKLCVYLCAIAVIVSISVAATIAYFTDTDAVTNTFTVGKVEISMDETNTDGKDAQGEANTNMPRDIANKYHLIPGSQYVKDPTVHVAADSESCWLFVKIDNGLAAIETDATVTIDEESFTGTILEQVQKHGWTQMNIGTEEAPSYIYYQKHATKMDAVKDYIVFDGFKIDGDKTVNVHEGETLPNGKEDIASFADANVTVTAYAIQATGFDAVTDAWDALKAQLGLNL